MRRGLLMMIAVSLIASACGSDGDSGGQAPTTTTTTASSTSAAPATTETPTTSAAPATTEPVPTTTTLALDEERRADVPYRPAGNTVIVYGDSMALSMSEHFTNFTQAGGRLNLVWRAGNGTSICSWLPGAADDIAAEQPWAAVVLFTNNTFLPCMADANGDPLTGDAAIDKYQADLEELLAVTGEAGVPTKLLTLPITRLESVKDNPTSQRINAFLLDVAARLDHVEIIDAATAVLDEDGNYTETLPCLPTEPCTGGVDDDGVPVNLVRDPLGG
ncbi:MAG: hypothetical protein OES57_07830, partial [Acidimicrobiia bacterium]|nr:hypothetical protein [Acidimicrobiia bacterium]